MATRQKLLAAAQRLYDNPDVGRERLTTAMVVAEAGVSIGTFYRYFDSETDIMDAIEPDRDLARLDILEQAALYGYHNGGELPTGNRREINEFLEAQL